MRKQTGISLALIGLLLPFGLRRDPSAQSTPTPAAPTNTEFPLPTPKSDPARITTGPDGTLWLIEEKTNKFGRITLAR